jgi:hypothetical protein
MRKVPVLDAVGDDCVLGPVQVIDTVNADDRSAGPSIRAPILLSRTARSVTSGSRGILQDGIPAGHHGGHHEILGAGDGDDAVETHHGAAQALRSFRFDVAVLLANARAEMFKPGHVEVDWARADGASARQ